PPSKAARIGHRAAIPVHHGQCSFVEKPERLAPWKRTQREDAPSRLVDPWPYPLPNQLTSNALCCSSDWMCGPLRHEPGVRELADDRSEGRGIRAYQWNV